VEASTGQASLVDLLVTRHLLEPAVLRDAMAEVFDLPLAKLPPARVDMELLSKLPAGAAREHVVFPLERQDTRLVLAVADPTREKPLRAVRRQMGLTLDLRLATRADLEPLVNEYYSPTLVALLPSGQTTTVHLRTNEIRIGKAESNDLVLSDPTVSRAHAFVRSFDSGYQVVDIESSNGVFVGDERVEGSATLKHGDVIKIGACLLTFKLPVSEAAGDATRLASPKPFGGGEPLIVALSAKAPAADAASAAAPPGREKKKKEKKQPAPKKESEKLTAAWIGFAGRIVSQIVAVLFALFMAYVAGSKACGNQPAQPPAEAGETNTSAVHYTSGAGFAPGGES
jgi:pSer/pThr/pTyr-binding forkhead associated (FHA) protein